MPIASQVESLVVTPMVHDDPKSKVDFGATVEGVDLNDIDREYSQLSSSQRTALTPSNLQLKHSLPSRTPSSRTASSSSRWAPPAPNDGYETNDLQPRRGKAISIP